MCISEQDGSVKFSKHIWLKANLAICLIDSSSFANYFHVHCIFIGVAIYGQNWHKSFLMFRSFSVMVAERAKRIRRSGSLTDWCERRLKHGDTVVFHLEMLLLRVVYLSLSSHRGGREYCTGGMQSAWRDRLCLGIRSNCPVHVCSSLYILHSFKVMP